MTFFFFHDLVSSRCNNERDNKSKRCTYMHQVSLRSRVLKQLRDTRTGDLVAATIGESLGRRISEIMNAVKGVDGRSPPVERPLLWLLEYLYHHVCQELRPPGPRLEPKMSGRRGQARRSVQRPKGVQSRLPTHATVEMRHFLSEVLSVWELKTLFLNQKN